MTNGAAFTKGLVLEHERTSLFAMTLSAAFIEARHGQAAGMFEDVGAVRIVALHAVHSPFDHGMMLGQPELSLGLQMALEASGRVFSRVDDEFAAPASGFDVLAARSMAGFATGLPDHLGGINVDSRMGAGGEHARDVGVAIVTGAITDVCGAGNFRGGHDRA